MDKLLKRWRNAIEKWIHLLWLDDHTRTYQLIDKEKENTIIKEGTEANFVITGSCECEPRYKKVCFSAPKDYIQVAEDASLDETACHEVIHEVIAPLNEVAWEAIDAMPASKREGWHNYRRYQMEFIVSHLTTVIRALHRAPKGKLK